MKLFLLGVACMTTPCFADLVETAVDYKQGGIPLQGHLVYEGSAKDKPGVLIIHAWGGIGEHEKERARMLAKLGYVAFCADIYGIDLRPKTQAEKAAAAGKFKGDRVLFRARLEAGLEVLEKNANPDKLAAIGYCFGGTGVLEMARMNANVRGVASFHGGLDKGSASTAEKIEPQVLVLHGADDPFVPEKQVQEFKEEFGESGASLDFISYPGAVHSFTDKGAGNDNSRGAAYNEAADKNSWNALLNFLKTLFK